MNEYDRQLTDDEIAAKAHRALVGGLWDELGLLQLDFLTRRGLRPGDRLLDIGCGALRGGLHFIRYLEPGRYYGVDGNASLIRAGRLELEEAGLGHRDPLLVVDADFRFEAFEVRFPFAIAQSLFTHLPLNKIERCLVNVAAVLEPGGRLYATYFESPEPHAYREITHPGGTVTHGDRDPFHYHYSVFELLTRGLPLEVRNVGSWNHPRSQHMLEFTRT